MKTQRFLAAVALTAAPLAASATATFNKVIDLSSFIDPATGVTTAQIAVDNSGATPIVYVTTLNNTSPGAVLASVPCLKIVDPMNATPTISVLDTNDASPDAAGGVASTRGYGGVGVDGSGNVFVAWMGNGTNDSARVRRYDSSGSQTGEWLQSVISDRPNGLAVNSAGTAFALARFFNTGTAPASCYAITSSSAATRTTVGAVSGVPTGNIRDLAWDDLNDRLYINANSILYRLNPSAATDLAPATNFTSGTSTTLVNDGANSFAAHGVDVSPNGALAAFTPNPGALLGARTVRVVAADGTLLETIGTLNTKGTSSADSNLGRASDVAFDKTTATRLYIADYDDNATMASRLWNRVIIYDITSTLPVELDSFGVE